MSWQSTASNTIYYGQRVSHVVSPRWTSFESTTALACASGDSGLAVQLKREIGNLGESREGSLQGAFQPFCKRTTWFGGCVRLQRQLTRNLDEPRCQFGAGWRAAIYSVGIHGNRLIALLVFLDVVQIEPPGSERRFRRLCFDSFRRPPRD